LSAMKSYCSYRTSLFTEAHVRKTESLFNSLKAKPNSAQPLTYHGPKISKWAAGIKNKNKGRKHAVRQGIDKQLMVRYRARFIFFKRLRKKFQANRRYLSARASKPANEITVRPALNRYLIGKELSVLLHKNVNLKLKNVFSYLTQKRRLKKNRFLRYL